MLPLTRVERHNDHRYIAGSEGRHVLMTAYRLFCLDHSRKITHAEVLDAVDDSEAINLAQAARFDAVTCEVWDADRLVTKFDGRNGGDIHGR